LGCFQELIIPKIDDEAHPIVKWQTITYQISWLAKWTYPVVCAAMGMSMGALIVK
jgi:hypothetical protein